MQAGVVRLSPPEGGSPVLVKAELTAGLLERGLPLQEAEEEGEEAEARGLVRTDHERSSTPEVGFRF